ncbi:divalent-cation tolerance protein CutA [Endothiovibrio diazotrophicus]
MTYRLVLCTVPDREVGERIASALVERRLAACVNLVAGVTSFYGWQGRVEREEELQLLIKTSAARYPELERTIVELHPYELPEVVAVPLSEGLPGYLAWIDQNTGTPS